MLRAIDGFVDVGGVRTRLAPFYSSTGRPRSTPGSPKRKAWLVLFCG